MNHPKTIDREHDLTYHRVASFKTVGITALFKVVESYRDRDLFHWYIDQDGVKYRACDRSCNQYGKMAETQKKWVCQECIDAEKAKEQSEQEKKAYKKRFDTRILEAVGEARKVLPTANLRKGRKRTTIVYDYSDGMVEKINAAIARFNLRLGYSSHVEHHNAHYNRRQAEVREFNPMRALEKILNGEKDE